MSHFHILSSHLRLKALVLLAMLLSGVHAQNALVRFYSPELRAVPGEIEVSNGFLTTLEFFGPVQNVYSGRQQNLSISVDGTKMFLGARVMDGLTDLQVEVEGTTLLFRLNIVSPGNGPRLYEVLRERPAPLQSNPLLQGNAPKNLNRNVDFRIVGVTPPNSGQSSVFFTFVNRSEITVNLDTARPRISQFGAALPYEVRKEPLSQLVGPGESQSGFFSVKGLQPGPAELQWQVIEMQGRMREVNFREPLDVPFGN